MLISFYITQILKNSVNSILIVITDVQISLNFNTA